MAPYDEWNKLDDEDDDELQDIAVRPTLFLFVAKPLSSLRLVP